MSYVPEYLKKWRADAKFEDYYVVMTKTRDSYLLEKSNFSVASGALEKVEKSLSGDEEYESLVLKLDETDDFAQGIIRYGHYAVGWIEYLLVHKDAPDSLLEAADNIVKEVMDYPILDEDDFAERELEAMDISKSSILRDLVHTLEDDYVESGLFTDDELESFVSLYLDAHYYEMAADEGHEEGYLSRRGIDRLEQNLRDELNKTAHRENRTPKEGYEDVLDSEPSIDYRYLEEKGQGKLPMSSKKRRVSSENANLMDLAEWILESVFPATTKRLGLNLKKGFFRGTQSSPTVCALLTDGAHNFQINVSLDSGGWVIVTVGRSSNLSTETGTLTDGFRRPSENEKDLNLYVKNITETFKQYKEDASLGGRKDSRAKYVSSSANIPKFYLPYFEAVLFTEHMWNDDPSGVGGDYLDSEYTVYDIDQESVDEQIKQIDAFLNTAKPYFVEALDDEDPYSSRELDMEGILHDFLLTRNHHGAGFWDGDYEQYQEGLGDTLTKLADTFGEITAYNGDDGKVYISRG